MSDDEYVDEELLALLRQSLSNGGSSTPLSTSVVLADAEFVYDNSIDVAIDMTSTKAAAESIHEKMQEQKYSRQSWGSHELHPKATDDGTIDFIFTMDLLNFSFWPDDPQAKPFAVEYQDKEWTGYSSILAVLWRALAEGIPITSPSFWQNKEECTDEVLTRVFRSSTESPLPLLEERMAFLREAGDVLCTQYNGSFKACLEEADGSALRLVQSLLTDFSSFRDETRFEGKTVHFFKRAQIIVADLWACFDGTGPGRFDDIDQITMFADYRVPQLLNAMGCIQYSPSIASHIKLQKSIEPGHSWEIQLRGCSIWVVELIRRQILRQHSDAEVNAILIDFFLYDMAKSKERDGDEMLPHHRCRTVWY